MHFSVIKFDIFQTSNHSAVFCNIINKWEKNACLNVSFLDQWPYGKYQYISIMRFTYLRAYYDLWQLTNLLSEKCGPNSSFPIHMVDLPLQFPRTWLFLLRILHFFFLRDHSHSLSLPGRILGSWECAFWHVLKHILSTC